MCPVTSQHRPSLRFAKTELKASAVSWLRQPHMCVQLVHDAGHLKVQRRASRRPSLGSLAGMLCATCQNTSQGTCGLVAMTSASHAEGRQFDPGQLYIASCPASMGTSHVAGHAPHMTSRLMRASGEVIRAANLCRAWLATACHARQVERFQSSSGLVAMT